MGMSVSRVDREWVDRGLLFLLYQHWLIFVLYVFVLIFQYLCKKKIMQMFFVSVGLIILRQNYFWIGAIIMPPRRTKG